MNLRTDQNQDEASRLLQELALNKEMLNWPMMLPRASVSQRWLWPLKLWLSIAAVWLVAAWFLPMPYIEWAYFGWVLFVGTHGILHLRFHSQQRYLAEFSSEGWQYDAVAQVLRQLENGKPLRELHVQATDQLLIYPIQNNRAWDRILMLEYRRPYPAQPVELTMLPYSRRTDDADFRAFASHLAELMRISLEDTL